MSDEPKKPLMVTGSVAWLIERDHWRVKAERLEAINAELLAACKAALEIMPIEGSVNYTGPYRGCSICHVFQKAIGTSPDRKAEYPDPFPHKPDCARVRLEAAIAKAEKGDGHGEPLA
jgi:hypothetical protein